MTTIPKAAIEATTAVLRAHAARIIASGMSADAHVDDVSEAAILAALPHLGEPVAWPNGCSKWAPKALRFLATNDRPSGGEQWFNAAHLYQLADEIEDAAKRFRYLAPPAPAVAIKPLEWAQFTDRGGALSASSIGGQYVIRPGTSGGAHFRLWSTALDYNAAPRFELLEAAKAAAQADYETRIRSALVDAPTPDHSGDVTDMFPAGWKLVPIEPTDRMEDRAADALGLYDHGGYGSETEARNAVYRAMLEAAPEPPVPPANPLMEQLVGALEPFSEFALTLREWRFGMGPGISSRIKDGLPPHAEVLRGIYPVTSKDRSDYGQCSVALRRSDFEAAATALDAYKASKASTPAAASKPPVTGIPATEQNQGVLPPADWLWYGESAEGKSHVSFGRWPKHSCQRRYKVAEIQPTEHDHRKIDDVKKLIAAAAEVERWWLEDQMQHETGAPGCMFAIREALSAFREIRLSGAAAPQHQAPPAAPEPPILAADFAVNPAEAMELAAQVCDATAKFWGDTDRIAADTAKACARGIRHLRADMCRSPRPQTGVAKE